jgi:hypothetical protein
VLLLLNELEINNRYTRIWFTEIYLMVCRILVSHTSSHEELSILQYNAAQFVES